MSTYRGVNAFNQEKALVGAFSVIVKSSGTFGSPSFQAAGLSDILLLEQFVPITSLRLFHQEMVPANSNNLFPFLYFPYFIETIGSKIMLARSSSVEDGDVLPARAGEETGQP